LRLISTTRAKYTRSSKKDIRGRSSPTQTLLRQRERLSHAFKVNVRKRRKEREVKEGKIMGSAKGT